jgi:hypothetical protein
MDVGKPSLIDKVRLARDSGPNGAKRRATLAEFAPHRVVHNDRPAVSQCLN